MEVVITRLLPCDLSRGQIFCVTAVREESGPASPIAAIVRSGSGCDCPSTSVPRIAVGVLVQGTAHFWGAVNTSIGFN